MGNLLDSTEKDITKFVFKESAENGLYYHYTNFDGFWKIIENDGMLATQALFSNDSQELRKGQDLVEKKVSIGDKKQKIDVDGYIICFCKQDDKLSQWRGYCRNGGVSLEFEINNEGWNDTDFFLYNKTDSNTKDFPDYYPIDVDLYPVSYCTKDSSPISGNQTQTESIIAEQLTNSISNANDFQKSRILNSSIPFIKDPGFYEEEEYRILFENYSEPCTSMGVIEKYIQYKDKDGMKSPFLSVKFGKSDYKHDVENIYIVFDNTYLIEDYNLDTLKISNFTFEECKKIFKTENIKEETVKSFIDKIISLNKKFEKEKITFHFKRSNNFSFIIDVGKNQRQIFEKLDGYINSNEKEIITPIWCKGHLPIRGVKISPIDNQDEIYDSIVHYFKHSDKYWLKYIKITKSETAFRTPKS